MSHVIFKRVRPDESRIYDADGEYVGDVYAHDDILNPDQRVYQVLLEDDPRGWATVPDRARVPQVAAERLLSHPYR